MEVFFIVIIVILNYVWCYAVQSKDDCISNWIPFNMDWRVSTVSSQIAYHDGAYALDDDLDTKWTSSNFSDQYIVIDFGQYLNIEHIRLIKDPTRIMNLEVQIVQSSLGSDPTSLVHYVASNSSYVEHIWFRNTRVRFIRFIVYDTYGDNVGIVDIRFFGYNFDECPTSFINTDQYGFTGWKSVVLFSATYDWVNNPSGITQDHTGSLLLWNDVEVLKLDPYLHTVERLIPAAVGIHTGGEIAIDANGWIYLSNRKDATIHRWKRGEGLYDFINDNDDLRSPTGIDFTSIGDFVVADDAYNTISVVYNGTRELITIADSLDGVSRPGSLVVSVASHVYWVDSIAGGLYRCSITERDIKVLVPPAELPMPSGIFLNEVNMTIWVSDNTIPNIRQFDEEGTLILSVDVPSDVPAGALSDLVVLPDSRIIVGATYTVKNVKSDAIFALLPGLGESPQHGGWSQWSSSWSSCSKTCGGGTRIKVRSCTEPTPTGEGLPCLGKSVKYRTCNSVACPTWNSWNSWSACSEKCGIGSMCRSRTCSGEIGACGNDDKFCQICQLSECAINGGWSINNTWSSCSETCTHSTLRTCTNPPPSGGGLPCIGNARLEIPCYYESCYKSERNVTITSSNNSSRIGPPSRDLFMSTVGEWTISEIFLSPYGLLDRPKGVALLPDGRVAVVNYGGGNIIAVNASSKTSNVLIEGFIRPLQVAVHNYTMFVSELINVWKIDFDDSNNELHRVRLNLTAVSEPSGLAVSLDGRTLFVSDVTARKVFMVDTDNPLSPKLDEIISVSDGLSRPTAMAVGSDGTLFVLNDRYGGVFAVHPQKPRSIEKIVLSAQAKWPTGIAIDVDEHGRQRIWVTDNDADERNSILRAFNNIGEKTSEIVLPITVGGANGVTILDSGEIVVLSYEISDTEAPSNLWIIQKISNNRLHVSSLTGSDSISASVVGGIISSLIIVIVFCGGFMWYWIRVYNEQESTIPVLPLTVSDPFASEETFAIAARMIYDPDGHRNYVNSLGVNSIKTSLMSNTAEDILIRIKERTRQSLVAEDDFCSQNSNAISLALQSKSKSYPSPDEWMEHTSSKLPQEQTHSTAFCTDSACSLPEISYSSHNMAPLTTTSPPLPPIREIAAPPPPAPLLQDDIPISGLTNAIGCSK